MKRFIITLILTLSIFLGAQANDSIVTQTDNVFSMEIKKDIKASTDKNTGYVFRYKGTDYPIYVSKNNAVFVIRRNMDGKEYKDYKLIPAATKQQILSLIGR